MDDLRTLTPDELERYAVVHHVDLSDTEREDLAAAYDEALADVDVLAMPTTPQTAHERLESPSRLQILDRVVNMLENTAPFDATGHPALSVPAGSNDGLPVGLMPVGEAFDDRTVLRAGRAVERSVDRTA